MGVKVRYVVEPIVTSKQPATDLRVQFVCSEGSAVAGAEVNKNKMRKWYRLMV